MTTPSAYGELCRLERRWAGGGWALYEPSRQRHAGEVSGALVELAHDHERRIAALEAVLVPSQASERAPDAVTLTIEYVKVGNDNTDAVDWDLGALAAICYEAGEHQGVHYLVPVNGSQSDMDAARDVLLSMIEGSGFPYRVDTGTEQP